MKCTSCGGEIASDQERCPYCKTINEAAVAKNKQISRKLLHNEKLKEHVWESSKEYSWNKILNRTMLTMAILLCALLLISFTAYLFARGELRSMHQPENIAQQLDDKYENRDFNGLGSLLEQYELMGADYYKYTQIALFQGKYEHFLYNRNGCMELIERKELPDDDYLEYALKYGLELLVPHLPAYDKIEEENQEILNEYQKLVMAFFQTYLRLEENEINDMIELQTSGNFYGSSVEETMDKVRERVSE